MILRLSGACCGMLLVLTLASGVARAADPAGDAARARAQEEYARGAQYAAQGDSDKAVEAYTRAVEWNDKLADAYAGRAVAYAKMGRNDLAIRDYSRAIDLDHRNPNTFNNRGMSYLAAGRNDLARDDFTRAIDLDAGKAIYRQNRASVFARMKEYEKAITDYTFVVAAQPRNGDAYAGRGAAYYDRGDARSAAFDFEKACSLGSEIGCKNLKAIARK